MIIFAYFLSSCIKAPETVNTAPGVSGLVVVVGNYILILAIY